MDSAYITPFIRSTQNVFETMLQLAVQVETPAIKTASKTSYDVSGIIGMSGDVEGAVALSFPTETAERVVSLFTGAQITTAHEDFADAVGELVNMISGGAKAQFTDKHVSISCPSVVVGADHTVVSSKDVLSIVIPCKCDCGQFAVEVSIRQGAVSAATVQAATASA